MIYKHSNITDLIIKAFFNVYNKLGYGFLEKVYENAFLIELRKIGLQCSQQYPIDVFYETDTSILYEGDNELYKTKSLQPRSVI